MKLNKITFLVLGAFFVILAIYGVFEGKTIGFGGAGMTSSIITLEQRPIEYSLSILFKIVIGILGIKKGLTNK